MSSASREVDGEEMGGEEVDCEVHGTEALASAREYLLGMQ